MRSLGLRLVLLFLGCGTVYSQQREIVPLSKKVGTTLDAEEKEILGLFPDIKGFQSAQFFQQDENRYVAKIIYLDHTRPRVIKRFLSWDEFFAMKAIADRHPEITEAMRQEHRYKLSYLSVHNILESIPQNSFCILRHISRRRISGTFVRYGDRTILFQAPTSRITIPITEVESITYRPVAERESSRKKVITFAISGLVGLGVGELWNLQSQPLIEIVWHNRFVGTILGLIAGRELFEAISILTTPKKFIAFTPEELARLK